MEMFCNVFLPLVLNIEETFCSQPVSGCYPLLHAPAVCLRCQTLFTSPVVPNWPQNTLSCSQQARMKRSSDVSQSHILTMPGIRYFRYWVRRGTRCHHITARWHKMTAQDRAKYVLTAAGDERFLKAHPFPYNVNAHTGFILRGRRCWITEAHYTISYAPGWRSPESIAVIYVHIISLKHRE